MNRLFITFIVICLTMMLQKTVNCQSSLTPYQKTSPFAQHFTPLLFGEVRPEGWIREQMMEDLDGFVGHLDELVPDLMSDSIYGKDRLTAEIKSKDVGNIGLPADPQYLWWNSETQSNWRDGCIRHAILLGDRICLENSEKYIRYILSTQDEDGYLGIYSGDLRYNFRDENGELWAKATLLRGLLAWYEYTGRPDVLAAIEKAVADVMTHYPPDASSPFRSDKPSAGGLTHGLMFTDVLDRLYQLTGNQAYAYYALFLYRDFSENVLNEDAQLAKIMDPSYKLKGHGVHTYEHLRPLAVAAWSSGNPALNKALNRYIDRIRRCMTPTGGPIGDEWIGGRKADATSTGYEYCSIHELMDSFCNLLQKSGEAAYGDLAEQIFFNAARGAHHPVKSCIAYCKTDNSYAMTGTMNGEPGESGKQTRFKYSPAHQDVAVCCVPNAGRIMPYYVKSMWMKDPEGLAATLLGPCRVQTRVNGEMVRIREETDYPVGNCLIFSISVETPIAFTLKVRKPAWAAKYKVSHDYRVAEGFILINRTWQEGDSVRIEFFPEPVPRQDQNQEFFYKYGALVFAHPIEGRETVTKNYLVRGLADLEYDPVNPVFYEYSAVGNAKQKTAGSGRESIWKRTSLDVTLLNRTNGRLESVPFYPAGSTILRQVTFGVPVPKPSTGTVKRLEKFSSAFVDARNVDIWLPEGYDPATKYAVLYMHDGQMLFDSSATWNRQEWGVDETLGKLLAERKVMDCIVVGIWNNSPYRHSEFFPQKALGYLDPAERENLLGYVKGEEKIKLFPIDPCADSYLKFLVTELKPYIDSAFSTLPDRKNTIIAGSSMGGLISLYALCEYPDVFGGAACLSTHWPGTYEAEGNPVPLALQAYLNDHFPPPKGHRIWFDYGSGTLDALYKPFQQAVDVIMKEKGYSSKNWITQEFPGEDHSENAWRRRSDNPLIFLLGK